MPGRYKVSRSNTTDTQAKERDRQHHQSKVEAGSVNYRSKEMIDAVIFFFFRREAVAAGSGVHIFPILFVSFFSVWVSTDPSFL